MNPPKTLEQSQKAIAQAVTRAYDVRLLPSEISADHFARDPRSFILKTAGRPHVDLGVAQVAALAISRASKFNADEALASTIADLMDGGVSLDRQAAAPRNLDALMARHRADRAKKNPLPSDLTEKKRAAAPRVIKRSGGSAVRTGAHPNSTPRVAVGARVRYRRLDDNTEHHIAIGNPSGGVVDTSARSIPSGSPLALALIGATTGTIVPVQLGTRSVELEILEVKA